MIFPGTALLELIVWIFRNLGLDLEISEIGVFDSLDEDELTDQLHHGRD